MRKHQDIQQLANASLLHEHRQQYEQTSVQRMVLLHQQLKHKNKRELMQLKKQILCDYEKYSFADYTIETLLLEIEIRLHKLNLRGLSN